MMKRAVTCGSVKSNRPGASGPRRSKLLCLVFLLLLLAAPVLAATPEVCQQYAENALAQLKQAKSMNIPGLNPPTWSDNFALHFGWCITASDADVKNGSALRQAVIDEHKNIPDAPPQENPFIPVPQTVMQPIQAELVIPANVKNTCENYAKSAVQHQQENIKSRCNQSGPEWNENYAYHYNWCIHGENYKSVNSHTLNRQTQLAICASGGCPTTIPGMTLGLRHMQNQWFDPFKPDIAYLSSCKISLSEPFAADRFSDNMFNTWIWRPVAVAGKPPGQYSLPPGIVVGINGSEYNNPTAFGENPRTGPEYLPGGTFKKMHGGDIGGKAGEGLYWYESTGLGFSNWPMVNQLPRGTIVGLRHSDNQPGQKIIWQGVELDATNPNIPAPAGFARKHGGDKGAKAGHGYYWYEKITGL